VNAEEALDPPTVGTGCVERLGHERLRAHGSLWPSGSGGRGHVVRVVSPTAVIDVT
jgi:hypothetical protein